jgi:symplekin
MATTAQTIASLNDARILALADASHYPEIVKGVLPLIGPNAAIELRRWGSDFLTETFSSPILPLKEKEKLSVMTLELFRNLLELPGEDVAVVKNVVQSVSNIYPLVYYHM